MDELMTHLNSAPGGDFAWVPYFVAGLTATMALAIPVFAVWMHKIDLESWRVDLRATSTRGASWVTGEQGRALVTTVEAYRERMQAVHHALHDVWVQVASAGEFASALDMDVPRGKRRHAIVTGPVYLYRWRWVSRVLRAPRPIFLIVVRPHEGDPAGVALLAEELAHVDQWFRTGSLSVRRGSVTPGEDLDLAGQAFRDALIWRATQAAAA